jgi:hypothetical protein
MNERTQESIASEKHQCKPSWTAFILQKKNVGNVSRTGMNNRTHSLNLGNQLRKLRKSVKGVRRESKRADLTLALPLTVMEQRANFA